MHKAFQQHTLYQCVCFPLPLSHVFPILFPYPIPLKHRVAAHHYVFYWSMHVTFLITKAYGTCLKDTHYIRKKLEIPSFGGHMVNTNLTHLRVTFIWDCHHNPLHKLFSLKGWEGENLTEKHIPTAKIIQPWFTYFLSTDIISCKHLVNARSIPWVCLVDTTN